MPSPYSPSGLDEKSGSFLYRKGGYREVTTTYVEEQPKTVIIDEDGELESKKRKRRGWIIFWVIAGVVLLIIIGVVAYFLFFRGNSNNTTNQPSTFALLGEDCTTKACINPFVCQQSICKSELNGPCPQGNGQCASGFVCSAGQCKVQFGGTCNIQSDCSAGLTCTAQNMCL